MEPEEVETQVIFRRWRGNNRTVIALLLDCVGASPGLIASYEHVGQHADANYNLTVAHTEPVAIFQRKDGTIWHTYPADRDAYDLFRELESRGYRLTIRKRKHR